jgi:hypothetical protein
MTTALGPAGAFARGLGPAGIAVALPAGVTAGLFKFAQAAVETSKALTQLQAISGQSFQNLSAMGNVFAQGGTKVKTFASEMGNLTEQIATAGQQKKIREAGDITVKWANDIDRVRQQFDNLANGARIVFSPLTTLDTKVEALKESLSEVPEEARRFKLADIFKNLGSDLERAQIGKALGLSPETIRTFSLGSAALRQMTQDAERLGLTLTQLDQTKLQGLQQAQTQAGALFDELKDKMGALAAPAFTSFFEGFKAQLEALAPAFQQLAAQFGQLDFSKLGAAAADFLLKLGQIAVGWAQILSGGVSMSDVLAVALTQAGQLLVGIASQIGFAIGEAIVGGVLAALAGLAAKIRDAITGNLPLPGGAPIGKGGIGHAAYGGLIGGRGTGTSDSNLAWVSRGEHIMPARAVRQPGMLAFLEALRRSGGNLSRVLDGMGRFALGGLVPRPAMAFAGGGGVGMSNVTIQFPGLPPVGGLRASSSVVEELRRSAALAQVRSGGRKPSRYS